MGGHRGPQGRVRRQYTVVTVPVFSWGWHQYGQFIQKLKGRQVENSLSIGSRFGEIVNQSLIGLDPLQLFTGEDRPGTLAQKALQSGTIAGRHGDIGIQ